MRLEISGGEASTDISTNHSQVTFQLNSSGPDHEEERTTRTLESSQENYLQSKKDGIRFAHAAGVRLQKITVREEQVFSCNNKAASIC